MPYNKISPEAAAELAAAVGAENYMTGGGISSDMGHDERSLYGTAMPEAVVCPESAEQVSRVLRICNERLIPVTTRGAGTGLTGAAVPVEGGVLLSTARMDKILGYDEKNLTVTVQPGVKLADLCADAAAHGLRYTPDPGEKTATLGGNAATNAGGPNADRYGSTRENVIGLKAVLATGEIVELGCGVRKSNSGYALLQLLIGSEGTLGVITELTLRLRPEAGARMGFIFPFESMEDCINGALLLRNSGLEPEKLEFMDHDIIEFSSSVSGNVSFPQDAPAVLMAEFTGRSDGELELLMESIAELAEEMQAADVLVVDEPNVRRAVEEAYDALHSSVEAAARRVDESNTSVPPSELAGYVSFLHALGEEKGLTVRVFGHASDGNVHACIYNDGMSDEEFRAAAAGFMDENYARCRSLNGAVSAEHGIGLGKKRYLAESAGPVRIRLMQGIKAAFDPNMVLNPGKIF